MQKLIKLQRENSMPTSSARLFRMNLAALVIPGVIRCGFNKGRPLYFFAFFLFRLKYKCNILLLHFYVKSKGAGAPGRLGFSFLFTSHPTDLCFSENSARKFTHRIAARGRGRGAAF